MPKRTKANSKRKSARERRESTTSLFVVILGCLLVGGVLLAVRNMAPPKPQASQAKPAPPSTTSTPDPVTPPTTNPPPVLPPVVGVPPMLKRPNPEPIDRSSLPSMEINQAVMVTVELDFGDQIPSIAEALEQIERRSSPNDRQGRTFAILDAYGEPTPDGKLHISMHVSTEKPGLGALVFKRTDQYLWHSQIVASTNSSPNPNAKSLTVLIGDGEDRSYTIDGSSSPVSILDATVKELQLPLREVWKDGEEREMTFIYSACGCPVKVMCRREGDHTPRTKELPVIFPDDPSVVDVITALMRW